jgi:hypothetical protein
MKKEYLILLFAGIALAIIVFKNKAAISVIKPGDKGNEVSGLQSTMTAITGIQFNNAGAYDNDTLKVVQYYLKNTNALINFEKGYVDKNFAADLYMIQSNMKNA